MVDISHAGDYAESVAIRAVKEGNAEILGVQEREHTSAGFLSAHVSKRLFTLVQITKPFEYGPITIDRDISESWATQLLRLHPRN